MNTPGPTVQTLPPAEEVIAGRSGDVLIKHTTLKADHFPSKRPSGCCCRVLPAVLRGQPRHLDMSRGA